MSRKNKTTETDVSVADFINAFVDKEEKKQDSHRLIELMRQWSGFEPKMWGPSIIGFGSYHYKYASGHEGDAPIVGFSPRKTQHTLYVTVPGHEDEKLLSALGKFTKSKSCIYFKKLSDLNLDVLEKIVKATLNMYKR